MSDDSKQKQIDKIMKITERLIKPKLIELLMYLKDINCKVVENADGSYINLDLLNDCQISLLLDYVESLDTVDPKHQIE